jgi:hypothetical protein
MGKKREYVVLRAIRAFRRRDPSSGLSGIRFRESMITGDAPHSVSTVNDDANGAPLDGGDLDVTALDADIDRAHDFHPGGRGAHRACTIVRGRSTRGAPLQTISIAALQRQPHGLGAVGFSITHAGSSAPAVNIFSAREGGGL